MTTVREWWAGARPQTLSAAIAPVAVGIAVGYRETEDPSYARLAVGGLLSLVVALSLQVAVNYANDYSDGVRGTDDQRVGPARLVGHGLAAPGHVRMAAWLAFGAAAIAGMVIVAVTGAWWLAAIGLAAIAAGWLYTGGPRPYGYSGLGEVIVFVFFGIVAVTGTTFVCSGRFSPLALVLSLPMGLLAAAILVVNNLRDIDTDRVAGKRTLAVMLGPTGTRRLWRALVVAAFAWVGLIGLLGIVRPGIAPATGLLALASAPLAISPWLSVRAQADPGDLVTALHATGRLDFAFGLLLALGVVLGGPAR